MKHLKPLFALLAVLAFAANMHGQSVYDFSAAAPTGQTLYFKICDSAQVSVVNPRTNNSDSNYVAGDLVIPETVSYCGTTYTVTGLSTHNFMMGTFYKCKTLTSVYVPNSVKTMGDYVFGYCPSLVSVHLPDSITSIPNMAFEGCTSLPSITIGRYVRNIFSDAFLHCYAISELHLLASVAPTVGYRALWSIPDTARVYIPCGSTSSYAAVPEWNNHFSAFIEEPAFVLEVSVDDETHGSAEIVSHPTCDNPQAVLLATANEGYRFEGWGITPGYQNIVTDNPLTVTVSDDMAVVAYFAADSTGMREYQSYFGQETTVWNAVGAYYDCPWENYVIRIAGDTVVDQQHYKKAEYSNVYWRGGYDEQRVPEYDLLLREERTTGRLWGRYADEDEDYLIADMSLNIGDTFYMRNGYGTIAHIVQDTATVDSRRIIFLSVLSYYTYNGELLRFVEGIGCTYNMGYLRNGFSLGGPLVCCHKDGELVYHNPLPGFPEDDCIIRAVGIDEVPADAVRVYSRGGDIVVEGADGEPVQVFDIVGRPTANRALRTGIYFVKVGNRPARKVTVIR